MTEEEKLTAEQTAETPPSEQTPPELKGKARAFAAYRGKYPDRFPEGAAEPEDDEVWDESFTELETTRGARDKHKGELEKIAAHISGNPELADMLANLKDSDFADNIKRNQESRAATEKANMELAIDFEKWADKNNIPEDMRDETFKKMLETKNNEGIFDLLYKGMNHDEDVEAAAKAAAAAEIEKKRIAKKAADGGLPDLDGGTAAKPDITPAPKYEKPYRFSEDLEEVK